MNNEETHPHFLNIQPMGEDLFAGQSQEKLKDVIAGHIKSIDNCNKDKPENRIIGIEGKWGCGKSNVIKMLEPDLNNYIFFTYDAWANQEDLQRRSILELLTQKLIDDGKLEERATIKGFDSKKGKMCNRSCKWEEKLQSLHAHKSHSKETTVPSLNKSTKALTLAIVMSGLLFSIFELLKHEYLWYDSFTALVISLSPIIFFSLLALCKDDYSFKDAWDMYGTTGKSETTSYTISEGEPTVSEFKDWMNEISTSLKAETRLVVVFDNMDRLPAIKVRQLWSLIYTFFADNDYDGKNVWCIVPFDEQHLAKAFDDVQGEETDNLLRKFLDKTFSVIYRVPEPVITDYKEIVNSFLNDAFGKTEKNEALDIINGCYRTINTQPNVREIISFINKVVSLRLAWPNMQLLSIAIYVLKEKDILKPPYDKEGNKTTDEYIYEKQYEEQLRLLLLGADTDVIQKDISALVYGIDPAEAYQIVVKRSMENCLSLANANGDLNAYTKTPHFVSLLEDIIKGLDSSNYAKATQALAKINADGLSVKDRADLSRLWSFMGEKYIYTNEPPKYSEYEKILLSHIAPDLQEQCAQRFYLKLVSSNIKLNGGQIYVQLEELFSEPFAKEWKVGNICSQKEIEPDSFLEYVREAKSNYTRFPVCANNEQLNDYIVSIMTGEFLWFTELELLKGDPKYNFDKVKDNSVKRLGAEPCPKPAMIEDFLRTQRVFFDKFQNPELKGAYLKQLWVSIRDDSDGLSCEEIYTLLAFHLYESLPYNDRHIDILKEKAWFYTSTGDALLMFYNHSQLSPLKEFVKVIIKEKIHDNEPMFDDFISSWKNILLLSGIDLGDLIVFADDWGYKELSEKEKGIPIQTLFPDANKVIGLVDHSTPLAKNIVNKAWDELVSQNIANIIGVNATGGSYWQNLLKGFVSKKHINFENPGVLKERICYILDSTAKNGIQINDVWKTLIEECPYELIANEVVTIRDKILRGEQGYNMTVLKFNRLHVWLEKSGINKPENCETAAKKIIEKVLSDQTCRKIIVDNGEYYMPILQQLKGNTVAEKLIKQINQ